VPVRVGPVDAAAAVVVVDLAQLLLERVGPEVQVPVLDPVEDLVNSSSLTRNA